MYIKVGHLPDPYRLPAGIGDVEPVGPVERIIMDEPNPGRLGPYIRRALRESFPVELSEECSESGEAQC